MKSTYLKLSMLAALTCVAYLGSSCGSSGNTDPHAGHNHAAETTDPHAGHDHAAEGEDHTGHDHAAESGDHTGHDHETPTTAADSHADHDHEAPKADSHDHAAEGAITMPAEQAAELGLTYEKATPAPFSSIIRTSGAIEGAEGDRTTVVATTSGIVRLGTAAAKGALTVGAKVASGAALMSINSETMVAGNLPQEIADTRDRLAKAKADLTRLESLSRDRIATAAELEAARLEVETTARRLETLTRSTASGAKSITTPRGGYITSLSVAEGDYVTEGQPLFTISANRTLRLRADLPLRYATQAESIRGANFTTPYDGLNHDISRMNGRLVGRGQSLAAGSATMPISFEFDNNGTLLSGTAVEIYLRGAERADVITVPLGAITEQQGAYFVYLRTCTDSYAKRAVELGESDGSRVEIVSGLTPGEDFVASGAYFVRLASMSAAIPDGHNH